jgi:hypothetical protein
MDALDTLVHKYHKHIHPLPGTIPDHHLDEASETVSSTILSPE